MITLCQCGCGLPAPISTYTHVARGYVKGQPRRFIHNHHHGRFIDGRTSTPEYRSFRHAKGRCTNPKDIDYFRYGGRGIQFLYSDFSQFIIDVGNRPSQLHSLERINNNGNYEPGNCKWATPKEQANNRREPQPVMGVDEATQV